MSPECKSVAARVAAALVLIGAVAGCGSLKQNEAAQAVINKRVVGTSAGDFFQQFGPWKTRAGQADGSTEYAWYSLTGKTAFSGLYGMDDRICVLHLVVAKDGRIAAAEIVQDNIGRNSLSRCVELFGSNQ